MAVTYKKITERSTFDVNGTLFMLGGIGKDYVYIQLGRFTGKSMRIEVSEEQILEIAKKCQMYKDISLSFKKGNMIINNPKRRASAGEWRYG